MTNDMPYCPVCCFDVPKAADKTRVTVGSAMKCDNCQTLLQIGEHGLVEVAGAGVSDDSTVEEFASDAYGMTAISCKSELRTNEGLRSFLESWDINPDA